MTLPMQPRHSVRTVVIALLTLAAAAAFLFHEPAVVPLVLWDESRVAVNALEMFMRGPSLVTTFEFAPDLWNTKPPLAVWLIVASFQLLGVSEFSLRLPSMIAAIGTLALVFGFTRGVTRSNMTAVLATGLLALSVNFFGPNGAKTAEYDAILCFFTTAYLMLLFTAIHHRRPTGTMLVAIGLLVAAAVLTKGVAGLLPGTGVCLYLLLNRRLARVLRDPRYVLCGLVAIAPVALFVTAREVSAPGYLAATLYNDATGRFLDSLDGHRGRPFYYFEMLFGRWLFVAGPATVAVPVVAWLAKGRSGAALGFAVCCATAPLIVLSFAATKLGHYSIPVTPWLAIATAIAIDVVRRRLAREAGGSRIGAQAVFLAFVAAFLVQGARYTAAYRYDWLPTQQFHQTSGYGDLIAELRDRGAYGVTIVEPGIAAGGFVGYAPQLHFYRLVANATGMTVARSRTLDRQRDGALATCDPNVTARLLSAGGIRARYSGCSMLLRSPVAAIASLERREPPR